LENSRLGLNKALERCAGLRGTVHLVLVAPIYRYHSRTLTVNEVQKVFNQNARSFEEADFKVAGIYPFSRKILRQSEIVIPIQTNFSRTYRELFDQLL
jgi:hypothetical protein